MSAERVYLDNAATSFPKPEAVYAAVDRYQRTLGCAVGRGNTRTGLEVQSLVDRCRVRAARLLGVPRAEQVLFTFNGTDALNLALHGLLNSGDRVVTTPWEHNSVLRPLKFLEQQGVSTTFLSPTPTGSIDLAELSEQLKVSTRLVVLSHASNVTGCVLPIQEAISLAHAAGALVLIDAAQTVGHVPINFQELGADLLAGAGHKGLLGPLGTGLLLLREGLHTSLRPIRQGGTGTQSELAEQPTTLPARYESGNHNAPGLIGLEAALEWIEQRSIHSLWQHEQQLVQLLLSGLQELHGLQVLGTGERVGVVSISAARLEPQVLATLLEEHFQIETRAGLHCAPRAHSALGTAALGGTVRLSIGPFNTEAHIEQTLEALAQIVSAF